MSPNTRKNINSIITSAADMSNQQKNMSSKNINILPNDINEFPMNFPNIFESFYSIQTIRLYQKMTRRIPSGSRRKKKLFPSIHDFCVSSRICNDFFVELKQNIPEVISKNTFNPTSKRFSQKKSINIDFDRS